MSRTVVLGYSKKEDAQQMAKNYSNDHTVMIIGPTDQVLMARETDDGVVWRSGASADLFVLVATKDKIAAPQNP